MNGLALCAGVGGLERGIESVFDGYKTVCYVEGEAYAASCLISQMEKGWVDQAPIWSNVRTFDGNPWRGKVDIISGGFPCQPFSKAGKQKGTEDERHLWPEIFRIIGEIRPSIVILENVPNVTDLAGSIIFADLAKMGYDSSWGIVRASDANAPHRRARFFSISIDPNTYNDGLPISIFKEECHDRIFGEGGLERSFIERLCSNVSDSNSFDDAERRNDQNNEKKLVKGLRNIRRSLCNSNERCEIETWKNSPSFSNPNSKSKSNSTIDVEERRIIRESKWVIESWIPEPGMGRMADGVANWMDRLRACGNGVVPQQAKLALEILICKYNEVYR